MAELYQDLLIDSSESFEDGNYFLLTITELELGTSYPLQFKWKYKDGTFGKDWSAVYNLVTPFNTPPGTPQFLSGNVVGGAGAITIEWNGKDSGGADLKDIDRVEVWISEPPFDPTKPAYSSKTKFKTQLQAPAGAYTVALYAVTVNGEYSSVSSAFTVSVTSVAPPVSPPTLPTGLSVATAPFAVSVNWSGLYSGSNFDGFKSIDIHARSSNVGSTATSGFSTTTQVATLTVNSTTNRQNIGLDNLRQALSLASNDAAYTAPMFFYYIARNTNNELYSVSGTPTYTRINSTTVNPTKANFVDLESGVISIENLVAGNGKFNSWLRTGGVYVNDVFQGGTRIELSGVNDFPDPTNASYSILKGLTAYNSGNTKIFDLDLDAGTLAIQGSGIFTGNLSIGTGDSIFKAEPSKGIWLGSATYNNPGDAPFSVAVNGALYSKSGEIAGWQINPTFLQNTSGTFKISSTNTDSQIQVGSDAGEHIRISAGNGIGHYLPVLPGNPPTLSNKFTLSPTGTSQISGWTIGAQSIFKGTTTLSSSGANGFIQIGSGTSFFKVSSEGLQLGNETFGDAPFRVSPDGSFVATKGKISSTSPIISNATQTVLIENGVIDISSTGPSFLSSGGVNIRGKNLSSQDVQLGMSPSGISFLVPENSGIITMTDGKMVLSVGGGPSGQINIGQGSDTTNLNVNGKLSVINGLNTPLGTYVDVGSSVGNPRIRNISASNVAKASDDPNGLLGDIHIQF